MIKGVLKPETKTFKVQFDNTKRKKKMKKRVH